MFITNMTNNRLGINGEVVLRAGERNLHVDETTASPALLARISRLERAKILSVVREVGMTKTGIRGKVVKTLGADTAAVAPTPRSVEPEVVEEKPEEKVVDNGDGTTTTTVKKRGRRSTKAEKAEAVEVENVEASE